MRPQTATNTDQTLTYTEGDSSVAVDDIVITEVDTIIATDSDTTSTDTTAENVTVTVTLSDSGAAGALTADSGEGESYDSSTGVWSISEDQRRRRLRHWQQWHLSLRPTRIWTSQRI